jgi:hypothetical protein
MALEQEINGSGQAKSGEHEKNDQVHYNKAFVFIKAILENPDLLKIC